MSFDYQKELDKLKTISKDEFMELIKDVTYFKGSTYYIPEWEVIKKYLTPSEYQVLSKKVVVPDSYKDPQQQLAWNKMVKIDKCFSEAGNYHFP